MENCYITIGRQYGCGGRIVGKKLSELLGIPYYDKDMVIDLIAKDCGLAREAVAKLMDKRSSSLLYEMATLGQNKPLEEQVFLSKTRIINQLADQGSMIVVGCCGDYILADRPNLLKVFLYGSNEERLKRIALYGDNQGVKAENELKRVDRQRADYYRFFTNTKWGERENYDLLMNTDVGTDTVARILEEICKKRFGGNE